MSDNLWYRYVTIYSLDVETFFDSNDDGIGDFQGLIQKLPYLKQLGIDCLWLLPFYPSPNRDDGYDIADFTAVDPRLGTLDDFRQFLMAAKQLGIYVLIDLVVNHTSDQHPWFKSACSDRNSPYREYYIWSDYIPQGQHKTIFPGEEDNTWTWSEQTGQYYHHRFYREQPDLNIYNPKVKEEVRKIIKFWLDEGVCGFRVDAVHILIQFARPDHVNGQDHEAILDDMRRWLDECNSSAVMLAEANDDIDKLPRYFGNSDRMHLMFDFITNQHLFLALARNTAQPLREAIDILLKVPIPAGCGYVNFIRKHDELNLGKLKEDERNEVFEAFAPEEYMRIYGRGIRRRLAPMLNNDRARMEMVYSIMFCLPGTSMIRYGDELGMGEDLQLKGRESIRTVMQWSSGNNAGFSKASAEALPYPAIDKGTFSYKNINVAEQLREESFLQWMTSAIQCRQQLGATTIDKFKMLESGNESVIVFRYDEGSKRFILVHNLSDMPASYALTEDIGAVMCFFGPGILGNNRELQLGRYGYAWLKNI
jgi:maltose alpha-D-glucosyltransferase/alpha-amylase